MAVTMKDIAEITGVSITTVDRALKKRGRINPEVAERIRQVAAELNYKPNSVAKSLSTLSKNRKIAIVLHLQRSNYFDEVEEGIRQAEGEISDFGIEVVVYRSAGFDASDQLRQIDRAIKEGASALVLVPIDDARIARRVTSLYEENFPVIFLTNVLSGVPAFASVCCDYALSGRIASGLIRILSQGGGKAVVFSNSFHMLGHKQRVCAFQDTLQHSCPNIEIAKIVELPASELDVYQTVTDTLREHPCQYILYSGNAKAGLKAIKEWGQPVTSVFYDLSATTRQALLDGDINAVIFQNPHMQGYRAVMLLHDYLTANTQPVSELIKCEIILRECVLPE